MSKPWKLETCLILLKKTKHVFFLRAETWGHQTWQQPKQCTNREILQIYHKFCVSWSRHKMVAIDTQLRSADRNLLVAPLLPSTHLL